MPTSQGEMPTLHGSSAGALPPASPETSEAPTEVRLPLTLTRILTLTLILILTLALTLTLTPTPSLILP